MQIETQRLLIRDVKTEDAKLFAIMAVVGSVGCSYYEDFQEIGITYFIGAQYRNNGYAVEAVRAYTKYFLNHYHVKRMIATVRDENIASWKVMEKAGFTLIEKRMYKDLNDDNEKLYRFYVLYYVYGKIGGYHMSGGNTKVDMINKLHFEMIKLYSGDIKRIQHFCKVHSYAKLIAEMENIDVDTLFILETAALTHDIGIHYCEEKYGSCNGKLQETEGPAIAKKLLADLHFEEHVSERVQYLIAHHHTYEDIDGIDYQILVEADFLVNLCEDGLPIQAIEHTYRKIFGTDSGKNLCREMFRLQLD